MYDILLESILTGFTFLSLCLILLKIIFNIFLKL